MKPRPWQLFAVAALFLVWPQVLPAGTVILKKAFIEKYKNRATIDVNFEVDHAHKHPNKIGSDGDDGDLHTAGRAAEVGLPMVSEVVNAAASSQQSVLDLIHQAEPNESTVPLSGAWRFWFEHPSAAAQVQGQNVPLPGNTNPDHCFEIHPVTKVKDVQVLKSFVPIPGFDAYDAKTAFEYYESLKVTVESTATATTINAVKAKYNYAEFVIELQGPPQEVDDDYFALTTVLDKEGNPVAEKLRRMVFVKGTPAADRIQGAKKGAQFHVVGIPRINLERISFITTAKNGAQVTTSLPYEMIIVGVFPE